MVLAGGIFSIGQFLALQLMTELQTAKLMTVKIVTALLGVILNLSGGYLFGLKGVLAGQLVFSLFYCFWLFLIVKKQRTIIISDAVN